MILMRSVCGILHGSNLRLIGCKMQLLCESLRRLSETKAALHRCRCRSKLRGEWRRTWIIATAWWSRGKLDCLRCEQAPAAWWIGHLTWLKHLSPIRLFCFRQVLCVSFIQLAFRLYIQLYSSLFIIASEMSKLQLMELFCFPSLSCGCEVLYVSTQQLSQLNACWNNAYRKVFKMNQ